MGQGEIMEIYKNIEYTPEERAEDLISKMSFEEKLGQLVGYNPAEWSSDDLDKDYEDGVGQVCLIVGINERTTEEVADLQRKLQKKIIEKSRFGIPAIFHVEALSGVMIPGATSFPSGIGQASTFNPQNQEEIGKIIGKQARAVGATQVLAPVLDISRDPRLGRMGEGYGEDPALASAMGSAYVRGVQLDGDFERSTFATAKHFLGYHNSQGGIHAATCDIPERLLREVYAKPFQAAITEANMQGIMPCYSSINGQPVAGSKEILTDLLCDEMKFQGIVVADYSSVREIFERHKVCESYGEAGKRALIAGLHQELPSAKCYTPEHLQIYKNDNEFMDVLNLAVKKVLTGKFKLGLFENPFAYDDAHIKEIYKDKKNISTTLKSARESLVLLKNQDILPWKRKKQKVAVIGYHANSTRAMFGGYSYMSTTESFLGVQNTAAGFDVKNKSDKSNVSFYQGSKVEVEHPDAEKLAKQVLPGSKNLLEELRDRIPEMKFTYAFGYPYIGNDSSGHEEAIENAKEADMIVMTVGGKYGTGTSSSIGEGIDGTDINLPLCQEELIEKLGKLGKPIVLIHFGGRPISSDMADKYGDAILEVWNPGEQGANAIVSTLIGEYNPGGKMPVTTPYSAGQIPIYYNHQNGSSYHQNTMSAFREYVDCPHEPRYYFGHGLSYTTFEYSNLKLDKTSLKAKDKLLVSISISNTGKLDGDEVVQLYIKDCRASMVRPVMELVGFKRIHVKAGETKRLEFSIMLNQLAFLDNEMRWKIEAGQMEILVGSSSADIRLAENFYIEDNGYVDGANREFYAKVKEI